MLNYKFKIFFLQIKKNILQILLFSLFIFLILILFQNFDRYYNQNDIAKIIILIILSLITFFGFLTKNLARINSILLIYFIIILYFANSLLVYVDYNTSSKKNIEKILKKDGKKFDQRSLLQIVRDERYLGKEIFPYVVPREFLKNDQKMLLPLTPMPTTEYISCNEYGQWKKIKTDKLGFNNEKFLKSFDILLMGDSFAEGSCVEKSFEPTQLLKNNYNKNVYNIGISGNGPLLSLALAHEIKKIVNFDYIVWLIYDNDFYDVKIESKSAYLLEYLKVNFTDNNYFSKLDEFRNYQEKYINNNIKSFKTGYSVKESLLELKAIVNKINQILKKSNIKENYDYNNNSFHELFQKLYHLYSDKKIFVVYLPETSCFQSRSEECNKRFLHLKNSSSKINFLNFYEFIKNQNIDYKKFYALGQNNSHFSEEGYSELVKFINKKIFLND